MTLPLMLLRGRRPAWALPAVVSLAALLAWPLRAQQPPAAPQATPPAKPAAARASAPGGTIVGVINRIVDGDSLWLQPEGKAPIEVRLRDIDAPEICQAYGPDAKKALEQFALGKTATLTPSAKDQHGRTVAAVLIDGQSVSKWMVAEGHAWSTRIKFDRGPLMKEERMAIALRRGIHATEGSVLPRDFRKTNGPCKP